MPCAICGGATLPAGKLCGACKAALKRARQETVSQLDPLPRRPSRGRRADTPSGREGRADTAPPPTRRGRIRLPASVVALGVVFIATGYFVSHLRGNAQGPDLAAASAGTAAPYVPLPTSAAPPQSSVEPFALPPRESLPAPPPPAKPAPPLRPKAPPPPLREAVTEPPRTVAAAVEPVAPAPVAARVEPPPPDRWQLLAAAVAQCGNGLGGALCEERVRWQYCDGFWGKVAQCPGVIGAGVPH